MDVQTELRIQIQNRINQLTSLHFCVTKKVPQDQLPADSEKEIEQTSLYIERELDYNKNLLKVLSR